MSSKYRITFGICTYNRKELLEQSVKSLMKVKDLDKVNIRVYDDCSSDYDESFLKSIFPQWAVVIRREQNGGADLNTSSMYEDFLKSKDEWLFNADSDLIYRTDLIEAIIRLKNFSNGFMSFFNCINHNTIRNFDELVEKDSVGAAGCLLNKDVVKLILDNMKYRTSGFDVGFCRLLRKKKYVLYATKDSYVQHIGVNGFNSRDINFDYGESFVCDTQLNSEIIEKTFEKYVRSVHQFRNKVSWKFFYFFYSIPRRIHKMCEIIRKTL